MLAVARTLKLLPAARREAGRSSRLSYVDGARALAALYVVLHHCFQWVWNVPGEPPPSDTAWLVVGWQAFGHYAVSAFIAISGFSLMLPVVRASGQLAGGAWTFFKRRARRIIPTYYAAIGFALLLDWLFIGQPSNTAWDVTLPITVRTVVTHLLLIHDLDKSGFYTINGVFWSIAIEWHIYFLFPLLVLLARRLGTLATTVGTLLLSSLVFFLVITYGLQMLQILPPYWADKLSYLPGRFTQIIDYVGLFALGMLSATIAYSPQRAWATVRRRVPWMAMALGVAIGVLILLVLHGRQLGTWGTYLLDILTALLTLSLFIAAASSTQGIIARVLGMRPLAFVGQYAYSIYLIHAPIVGVIFATLVSPYLIQTFHLSRTAQNAILIAIVLPVVLVMAYGFYLLFERPFIAKRPSSIRPTGVLSVAGSADGALVGSTPVIATMALAPGHDGGVRSQPSGNDAPPFPRHES